MKWNLIPNAGKILAECAFFTVHDAQHKIQPSFMRIFAVDSGLVHRQDKSDIAEFHLP